MYTVNGNSIKFNNNDFIAKGGQGSVYVKGGTVFKIYTDKSEMISKDKIRELKAITDKRVLVPKDLIMDKHDDLTGFTMDYVKDTTPLIKLFNNAFRNKVGFTEQDTIHLIEQMQQIIQHIHDKSILQVDGNELNYLVGENFNTPYFIDVDSYQTKNHKATVLMPSIRDWQANHFSALTDWYSFGIIACQLFVGLHPYKGRHKSIGRDLKKRALKGISIFNKEVSVPSSVRDFGLIPSEYMKWFQEIFENGKRIPPPLVAGTMSFTPSIKVISGSNLIQIEEVKNYDKNKLIPYIQMQSSDKVLNVSITYGKILITDHEHIAIRNIYASEFMISGDTVYAKNAGNLYRINMKYFNRTIIPQTDTITISKHSSKILDGMIYQDLLGKSFVTFPTNKHGTITPPIPELDNYTIIDGKYENKVAMFIGLNKKTQKYDKIVLVMAESHINYNINIIEDVDYDINFTVLETGVVLEIYKDGLITIFFNDITKTQRKEIKDDAIKADFRLRHEGSQAMFETNGKVFMLTMG